MDKVLNLPFVNAWLKMLANFSDFKGRTSREDYWWAVVGNLIISIVLGLIGGLLGSFGSVLVTLISLVLAVPGIALTVRRLHDIGKSGWFVLISLVPLVGVILLIVWLAKVGDEDDNQYGSNPKYVG